MVIHGSQQSPKSGTWKREVLVLRNEGTIQPFESGVASAIRPGERFVKNRKIDDANVIHDVPEIQNISNIRGRPNFVMKGREH